MSPVWGSLVPGAREAMGSRTNLLSLNLGWGRVSQGVSSIHSPCTMMSRSMVLGPPVPFPVLPMLFSISWSLARSVKGERWVWTWTAPLTNQGWGGPRGSLRNQGETFSRIMAGDASLSRASRQLASLEPRLEPKDMKTVAMDGYYPL